METDIVIKQIQEIADLRATIATLRAEVEALRDNLSEARVQVDERTDEAEAWRMKYHTANDKCGALESTLNSVWIELVDDPAEDALDHDGMPKRVESIRTQLAERTAEVEALRAERDRFNGIAQTVLKRPSVGDRVRVGDVPLHTSVRSIDADRWQAAVVQKDAVSVTFADRYQASADMLVDVVALPPLTREETLLTQLAERDRTIGELRSTVQRAEQSAESYEKLYCKKLSELAARDETIRDHIEMIEGRDATLRCLRSGIRKLHRAALSEPGVSEET